jgi:hypothetical protein
LQKSPRNKSVRARSTASRGSTARAAAVVRHPAVVDGLLLLSLLSRPRLPIPHRISPLARPTTPDPPPPYPSSPASSHSLRRCGSFVPQSRCTSVQLMVKNGGWGWLRGVAPRGMTGSVGKPVLVPGSW